MEWYLKKPDDDVYGPVALQNLVHWSIEGRLAPDDLASQDQETWKPVGDIPELGMDWIVALRDGEKYGPLHMMALAHLLDDGAVESHSQVVHKTSGEQYVLSEALLGALMDRAASLQASFDALSIEMLELEAELQSYRRAGTSPGKEEQSASQEVRRQLKEFASRSDMLQKEVTKWKNMYESERSSAARRNEQLNVRIEDLRQSDAQGRARLEETARRLKQLEQSYATMMQAAEAAAGPEGAQALAGQFGDLMASYNQLSHSYDKLFSQLEDKSREMESLIQSRQDVEQHAEERIRDMEALMKREKEEADQARRKLAEMEETHYQLVKSYRDMNSRFIQLRQQTASQAPPAAETARDEETKAADSTPDPRQKKSSRGPRIRLNR